MKITGPLFKWFGSKWLSARLLPCPQYDTIVEPFAGSAGYSLRHFGHRVLLAERDPHLFELWRWFIQDATESGIREIPIGLPEGTDIRTIGLSPGQALLLKTWQRTNNVGTCWTVSPWGNKPGQWTENTRARVSEEFHGVRHWSIQKDAQVLLSQGRAMPPATWLVDPPYRYNYQYRGAPPDYAALGRAVQALHGQILVCEAACPKSGAIPDWLPFVPFGNRITSRRKTGDHHHSKELIWVREETGAA